MSHAEFVRKAAEEAATEVGASPGAGALLVKQGQVIARGRNRTRQLNDPVATAEMDCIRGAGRRNDHSQLTLYSTCYPNMLTVGTVLQFSIGAVVVGLPEIDSAAIDLLKSRDVPIDFVEDQCCVNLHDGRLHGDPAKARPTRQSDRHADDQHFLRQAYLEALDGYEQGGVPVGAVMVRAGKVIARGRNKRVQEDDPIMHGETDCLRSAGLIDHYGDIDLYTTLSPCMMCSGAIIEFGIKRVVVGENQNFPGNIEFLRRNNVQVILADDAECRKLMSRFIAQRPDIWDEDIAGNEEV